MPTITLPATISRYFAYQHRANSTHTQPRRTYDIPTTMSGSYLHLNMDPPPPPPKLDIILVTGHSAESFHLGKRLAQDLGQGYTHLYVIEWLAMVNAMADGPEKSHALSSLHPLTLQRYVTRQQKSLSPRLVVDILIRRIQQLVKAGTTKFVITGLGCPEYGELWHFRMKVAVPEAVVLIHRPVERLDVKGWARGLFGEEKVIIVDRGEEERELWRVYGDVLSGIMQKALEQDGGFGKLDGESDGEKQKTQQEQTHDDGDQTNSTTTAMIAVANAALRDGHAETGDSTILDTSSSSTTLVESRIDPPVEDEGVDVKMDIMEDLEDWCNEKEVSWENTSDGRLR